MEQFKKAVKQGARMPKVTVEAPISNQVPIVGNVVTPQAKPIVETPKPAPKVAKLTPIQPAEPIVSAEFPAPEMVDQEAQTKNATKKKRKVKRKPRVIDPSKPIKKTGLTKKYGIRPIARAVFSSPSASITELTSQVYKYVTDHNLKLRDDKGKSWIIVDPNIAKALKLEQGTQITNQMLIANLKNAHDREQPIDD